MSGEITFTPTSYDFGKVQLTATKPTTKIIITNKSNEDILLNSITLPDGFTYEFIDEFPAYQPYDFHSIYQNGFTYEYIDNSETKEITYKGFKNIYNLKDPIVCCKDVNNTSCCDKLRKTDNPTYFSTDEYTNEDDKLLMVYVPYGCFSFKLTLKTTDNNSTIAISRFGKPPDNFYENEQTGLTDSIYTSAKNDYYDLRNLITYDSFSVPNDNILKIVHLNLDVNSSELDTYSGKWIYVIVRTTGTIENVIIDQQFLLSKYDTVDTSKFRSDGDPQYDSFTTIDPGVTNSTEYVTITHPFHRAIENTIKINLIDYDPAVLITTCLFEVKGEYSSTNLNFSNDDVCQPKLRIFMPPGTYIVNMSHITAAFNAAVIRFNEIPTTEFQYYSFDDFKKKITQPQSFGEVISDATGKDHYSGRGGNDNLEPVGNIAMLSSPCEQEKAGWIYEKLYCYDFECAFSAEAGNHNNNHSTKVSIDEYNQWWDHGGSNTDGSINWDKDVESVKTYKSNGYKTVAKTTISTKNTTSYKTIHNRYHRIPNNLGNSYVYGLYSTPTEITTFHFCPVADYIEGVNDNKMVRMFIPPGTVNIDFFCLGTISNNIKAISRYNKIPTTDFSNYQENKRGYKNNLNSLMSGDCFTEQEENTGITGNRWGKLYICYEDLTSSALSKESSGWLYVKLKNDNTVGQRYIFQLTVHRDTYNDWWDKYGSNSDGSINWDVDIEPVTSYISKI